MNNLAHKKKIGFVILHYLALDMTQKSVDTLLNTFNDDIEIAIVDNASYNMTGEELEKIYQDIQNVHILLNSKNEGFAKGNNKGYSFLKEKYECEYIVILNNDVLIDDKNFLKKVRHINSQINFDILGPDIFVPIRQIHQNPVNLTSDFDEKKLKNKIRTLRWLDLCFPINFRINLIYWKIRNFFIQKDKEKNNLYLSEHLNPLLHGACYIFSEKFINTHLVPFNPNTFLFFEEDILFFESMRDGLIMYYSPDISVKHLEDVATNIEYKTYYDKEKMKTKEQLKSALVFKKIMEEDKF